MIASGPGKRNVADVTSVPRRMRRRVAREAGERRPRVRRTGQSRIAVAHREEVVGAEERVEAELLGASRDGEQVVVGRALLRFGEDAKSHFGSLLLVASDALIEHLLTHSVRTGDFVLKSGKRSNWFIDSKQTVCRPDGILLVAEAALEVIPSEATAIGGLTQGADPVAFGIAAVAATRGRELRCFSIRREAKDHGVMGRVAGPLLPGDKVVVTEDTATRGTSALEAAKVIRDLGAEPIMILVVVDRGGTGGRARRRRGHRVPRPRHGARSRLRLRRRRLSVSPLRLQLLRLPPDRGRFRNSCASGPSVWWSGPASIR